MCQWYRTSFECGHYLVGALTWCEQYGRTQRRCEVNIAQHKSRPDVCPHCRSLPSDCPWEHMINRSKETSPIKWFKESKDDAKAGKRKPRAHERSSDTGESVGAAGK